jgi:uncharacterized protein (TIGR04255 family)
MSLNTLTFPAAERVIYGKNPLSEVVCQLRFPTILRVTSEIPAAFQERIRHAFPEYAEELNPLAPTNLPPQLVQLLSGSSMAKRHRFSSNDGMTSVLLDGQSLTFVTTAYKAWEDFSALVFSTVDAFFEEYKPSSISRIGLRYQNAIPIPDVSEEVPLQEYLREELLGVLVDSAWRGGTFEFAASVRCKLQHQDDKLLIQYGLLQPEEQSDLFSLDFDYYIERETEPKDAADIIVRLHGYSGPAFRWAIRDRLHNSLEPRPAP